MHSDRIYKTVYPKAAAEFLRVGGYPGLASTEIDVVTAKALPFLGDAEDAVAKACRDAAADIAIVNSGGFSITFDKGGTFFSPMNLPLTQFYHISVDDAVPYNVCGGSQDNGNHCGPSRRISGA